MKAKFKKFMKCTAIVQIRYVRDNRGYSFLKIYLLGIPVFCYADRLYYN
jgi:hypothetical protein